MRLTLYAVEKFTGSHSSRPGEAVEMAVICSSLDVQVEATTTVLADSERITSACSIAEALRRLIKPLSPREQERVKALIESEPEPPDDHPF